MNYTIEGAPMPVVICNLEGGETMLTEKGAMSWMSPNMKMETTTGGGIGKMFGRAFSGESMFINRYTAQGGTGLIAFASSFPGDIRAFEIAPGQEIIAQKSAFLASTAGVEMSVFSKNALPAVSSAEKVLLCSVCPETAPSFSNLTDTSKNMNLHRDSRCRRYRISRGNDRRMFHRYPDCTGCKEYALWWGRDL